MSSVTVKYAYVLQESHTEMLRTTLSRSTHELCEPLGERTMLGIVMVNVSHHAFV